ncbi:MAG: hypothetical protein ACFFD4_39905 [Candidatus Odinarchaeota archaeon]
MALLEDERRKKEPEKAVDEKVVDEKAVDEKAVAFRDECINSFKKVNLPENVVAALADSYYDLESIKMLSESDLRIIPAIGRKRAALIVKEVRKYFELDVIEIIDLNAEDLDVMKLSTGSDKLDELLDGGVEQACTTEFNGPYSTGKTQLAYQLAINTQLPVSLGGYTPDHEGAPVAKAVVIDTEKSFERKRIVQMSSRFPDLDPKQILSNIKRIRPKDAFQEVKTCELILKLAEEENFRTVIFDSVLKNIKQETWGNWFRRADYVNQIICMIGEMEDRDLTVVAMNQIRGNPDRNVVEGTGGEAWHHKPKHIIQLKWYAKKEIHPREEDSWRKAQVFDSPTLNPRIIAPFKLDELGIMDIPS